MAFELLLKGTSANEFNLSMRYLEMRSEGRKLSRAEHDVVKADKRLAEYFKKHKLLEAKQTMNEENKGGYEVAVDSHRLILNDFIAMRVLEKLAQNAYHEIEALSREIKQGRAGMAKKMYQTFLDEQVKFEEGFKMSVGKMLARARKILDSLMKKCEGGVGVALAVKQRFFSDISLLNYFKLRSEAKGEKRYIEKVKRAYQLVKKEKALIERKRRAEKASKDIIKNLHVLTDAVKDAIAVAFKLFMNSALLMDVVINIIQGQLKQDKELIEKHQIPTKMGQDDETVKTNLLEFFKKSIRTINTARLQLQFRGF